MEFDIPKTAYDQRDTISSHDELIPITERLHQDIINLLSNKNIPLIASTSRTKSPESVSAKLRRRGWDYPIPDVHGVRLIVGQEYSYQCVGLIMEVWPSPEVLPWGIINVRDYSKQMFKDGYNSYSTEDYQAIHLNIVIPDGAKLAEVQIMTPEQLVIAERTRVEYLRNRSR